MVVLHLLGIDFGIVFQSLIVVATGVVEVAQVEACHVAARTLGVKPEELLQAVGGIVVVKFLGAYARVVGGIAHGDKVALVVGPAAAHHGAPAAHLVVELLR